MKSEGWLSDSPENAPLNNNLVWIAFDTVFADHISPKVELGYFDRAHRAWRFSNGVAVRDYFCCVVGWKSLDKPVYEVQE